MTLGHRCDEIVRLIDETLLSVGAEPAATVDVSSHPSVASLGRSLPDAGGDRRRAGARLRLRHDLSLPEG